MSVFYNNLDTALLIVDVQNDFLPGGSLAVREGDVIIPYINSLIPRYETVVATQDWHPADHMSFAANNAPHIEGEVIDMGGVSQVLWPVHCVQETHGASFSPKLAQSRISYIVQKGTHKEVDSYSGFFDNLKQHHTSLHQYLQKKKITAIDICGLATDYCVKFTALDAVELGYHTTILTQGCRGVNLAPTDLADAIEEMQRHGVIIK